MEAAYLLAERADSALFNSVARGTSNNVQFNRGAVGGNRSGPVPMELGVVNNNTRGK